MSLKIKENVSLAPLTTFKVGGNALYFVEAKTSEEVIEALQFAAQNKLPVFVFGGGSNILVSDEGFNGLVIVVKIKGIRHEKNGDTVVARVGAGEDWSQFVEFAVSQGWSGLETLSGIPGSVGGAPVQNIGAYGSEASHVIKEVVAYDMEKGAVVHLDKQAMDFGYRKSLFNTKHPNRYIILEVVFEFKTGGEPSLNYHDLKVHFEGPDRAGKPKPSLKDVHLAVLEIRAKKGMVINPNFESYKSAGSFFKNPVVEKDVFEAVQKKVDPTATNWFWPQQDGRVKVSAAKLIELAGFKKGDRLGEAGISPKHALSLINLGNAKAADILALAKKIIDGVYEKFSIRIEPEVLLIGFDKNPLI